MTHQFGGSYQRTDGPGVLLFKKDNSSIVAGGMKPQIYDTSPLVYS